MNLPNVFSYYDVERKLPIPYKDFEQIGWDRNIFFIYLQHMEEIRSALIICHASRNMYKYDLSRGINQPKCEKLINIAFDSLETFFENYLEITINLNELSKLYFSTSTYEIIELDSAEIHEPALKYRSLDHIRLIIEKDIYHTMCKKDILYIKDFHACNYPPYIFYDRLNSQLSIDETLNELININNTTNPQKVIDRINTNSTFNSFNNISINLNNLYQYYNLEHNFPIPYEKFSNLGFSYALFSIYQSHIEEIRSTLIIYYSSQTTLNDDLKCGISKSTIKSLVYKSFGSLYKFLYEFSEDEISFTNMSKIYYLNILYEITYTSSAFRFMSPDKFAEPHFVYKSLDDVRLSIEERIYGLLNGKCMSLMQSYPKYDNIPPLDLLKSSKYEVEQLLFENESKSKFLNMLEYSEIQKWASWTSEQQDIVYDLESLDSEYDEMIDIKEKSVYTLDKVLYVHKGTILCKRNHHKIIPVNVNLPTLKGNRITINANYCTLCDRFFISKDEYDYYRKKYPGLLANFKFLHSDFTYYDREEYSKLTLLGYSVGQDGPSEMIRQNILIFAIKNKIMSKDEIIDHLNMLINTNGMKIGMKSAVEKWTNDLAFVRNYNIENQDEFYIDDIQKYHLK